ncbi:MAG: metallophosphoesterase [Parvularculaceae bacterium]
MISLGPLEYLKLAVYYASYLYVVAAPLCLWLMARRRGRLRAAAAAFFVAITCLAYGRFVEPRMLLAAEHDVLLASCGAKAGAARIAVISDLHQGIFANAMPIERIARRIDVLNPDFTLIAGDLTYYLDPERFEDVFAPLGAMRAPVFAVLGNHDIGLPGPDLSADLTKALAAGGVAVIDNTTHRLSNSKFDIDLVGLSDLWGEAQDLSLLLKPPSRPRLVLTHNPATVEEFWPGMSADLLIAGHTHGGQIQLPLLTCLVTGVCGDWGYGLREGAGVSIFTTSGTGMSGLPMRFRVPPRIDVLNVRYPACGAAPGA